MTISHLRMEATEDGFNYIFHDGLKLPISFTVATGEEAATHFLLLCQEHLTELHSLMVQYDAKRTWNFKHEGQGKNWPAFSMLERFLKRLQKQANIIDS